MSKPRDDIERRQKLARHPHAVEIRIPPAGLGQRLGEMHAWALRRCGPGGYLDSGRMERDGPEPVEFVRFHFPDAQTAREFAARFEQLGARLL